MGGTVAVNTVRLWYIKVYSLGMDVGITELRAHLGDWLGRVRDGDAVVVTDRGVPIARLVGIESADVIERLTREGIVSRPTADRRRKAAGQKRARSSASVSDLVSEQRASR